MIVAVEDVSYWKGLLSMVHGLDQSQAQADAARELSAAKVVAKQGLAGADALLAEKKVQYRKALQEYIDPFKIYRDWGF